MIHSNNICDEFKNQIHFIQIILTQLCVTLFNFIIKLLKQIKKNSDKFRKLIKFEYYLIGLKVLCFSLLTYSALLVTFDYFKYSYFYKLKVIHNINGFDLPDISFCTDSTVLFDRSQMFHQFNQEQNIEGFIINQSKRDKYQKYCIIDDRLLMLFESKTYLSLFATVFR